MGIRVEADMAIPAEAAMEDIVEEADTAEADTGEADTGKSL
jgi:hypothetical protein